MDKPLKPLHIKTTAVITLLMLFSSVQGTLALDMNDLKDVSPKNPQITIYLDLLNSGAFSLDNQKQFRPDATINKAAFLKAAMGYLGYIPTPGTNNFTGYSDVPEDSWFAPYVKKALSIRAITNNLNEKFYPEANLTRQEALVLTMHIYGIPTALTAPSQDELFTDIRITHPLSAVYAAAKASGIYFEDSQESFLPNLTLTRGDAADLLFKAKLAASLIPKTGIPHGTVTVTPVLVNTSLSNTDKELLENDKFGLLLDTWDRIHADFVYAENYSNDSLIYGAISGMVESLDDPYSVFNSPDSDGNSYIYIPDDYEGIGAVIEQIDGQFQIMTTINNSPAYRAGLKSKDVIHLINGQNTNNLTYEQVTSLIKGKAGSVLKLEIKRDNQYLNFEIVREKITIESIQNKSVGNNINYVRIDQFTETTSEEFSELIKTFITSGSNKLIIDLRNNPGGYLTSTQEILGQFVEKGQTVFLTVAKNGAQTKYSSPGDAALGKFKIVVLVNEGSASAAEIFAGALQDYGLARIIGNTTFGKGSVQEINSYTDNSSLKLTIAKWLTPKLRDVDHKGLVPDQTVLITDLQKQSGQDPQLDAAISYLK